jgi:single-stranded-DNA-specific exonuclease
MVESKWQIVEKTEIVTEIIEAIQPFIETLDLKQSQGEYIAQLLQQRGITNPQQIRGFIDANQYNPTSAFAFGEEMTMAINRLVEAYQEGEKIAIYCHQCVVGRFRGIFPPRRKTYLLYSQSFYPIPWFK